MTVAQDSVAIGIIGTAGRKDDAEKLNPQKYQMMKAAVLGIIAPHASRAILFVSGGAAVADHLAVQLFLALPNTKLRLHLPAVYDTNAQRFIETPGKMFDPGNVANFYHRKFWKTCQQPSLAEINQAIRRGAEVKVTPGFKERNTQVAQDADVLIALTFGDGPSLKDGGTRDTMEKFLRRRHGTSFHVDLHNMAVHSPATIHGISNAPELL